MQVSVSTGHIGAITPVRAYPTVCANVPSLAKIATRRDREQLLLYHPILREHVALR